MPDYGDAHVLAGGHCNADANRGRRDADPCFGRPDSDTNRHRARGAYSDCECGAYCDADANGGRGHADPCGIGRPDRDTDRHGARGTDSDCERRGYANADRGRGNAYAGDNCDRDGHDRQERTDGSALTEARA